MANEALRHDACPPGATLCSNGTLGIANYCAGTGRVTEPTMHGILDGAVCHAACAIWGPGEVTCGRHAAQNVHFIGAIQHVFDNWYPLARKHGHICSFKTGVLPLQND
eukprot:2433606-Lingulodinium_polyedra.AAC.1